ncbi:MAG: methylisocitrate lyase [Deltaproteobacteria bacterium]|nr:methylisocitrate lyase [Deltaproteobacteria bacterium]
MKLKDLLKNSLFPKTIPGAFNAASALLIEDAGFPAVYVSGAGLSAGCGLPDTGELTLVEVAVLSSYITNAVNIPVIIDADTGFGGPGAIKKTIAALEGIGASAIQLEDQTFPKRCGHLPGKGVIPAREFAKKIKAAVKARASRDFLVICRTDARAVAGIDDAIGRAKIYLDAGADAIFPEALANKKEFAQFAVAVDAPLVANMTEFGRTPYITVKEFGDIGYAAVLFPMTAFRASMKAAKDALRELKAKGTQKGILKDLQTRTELYELLGYSPSVKKG